MEDVSDNESYFSVDSLEFSENNEIDVVPFYSGNVPVTSVRKLQQRSKSTTNNKNCASKQNSDYTLDLNSPNSTSSFFIFKEHYLPKRQISVRPRKPVGSYLEQYYKRLNSSAVKSHDTVSLCMLMDSMSSHTISEVEDDEYSQQTRYTDTEFEYYENLLCKFNENNPSGTGKSIYTQLTDHNINQPVVVSNN